jgi:hypothetical protein
LRLAGTGSAGDENRRAGRALGDGTAAALVGMAAVILTALAVAWLWHAIDLFRPVDVETLPLRARRRFAGALPDDAAAWVSADVVHAPGVFGAGMRPALRAVGSNPSR